MPKKIVILGSTGEVGKKTLEVVRHLGDAVEVVALAAKSNAELLYAQALEFSPRCTALFDREAANKLRDKLPSIPVLSGIEGLQEIAALDASDFCLLAMSGTVGLLPAVAAIEAGKQIGLANKELLVCAGEWIVSLAARKQAEIIPVDSEHSAIYQCLQGESKKEVRRLIFTASGGSLRDKKADELEHVTVEEVLSHPNWLVGPKSAVDCSTLMNKGFEMIQAHYLFGVAPHQIEAVIHPQSRMHGCVEFLDGSILALLAEPDMSLPIQYALTYPERKRGLTPAYDFFKHGALTFYPPDTKRFPCLQMALHAMQEGKSYPCFLNGANEVLVERFLARQISWSAIAQKLEKLISFHKPQNVLSLEEILSMDQMARELASQA